MKRWVGNSAVTVVVALLAIVGWQMVQSRKDLGSAHRGVTEVSVALSGFSPRTVEVKAGTTVTWHFDDSIPHDVTGDGFRSPSVKNGSFSHTFTDPGTYDYRCSLHPIMRGRVIVTAS